MHGGGGWVVGEGCVGMGVEVHHDIIYRAKWLQHGNKHAIT